MSEFKHIPIMLKEVLELLKPERGGIYADGTLGGGGHSSGICARLGANGLSPSAISSRRCTATFLT